MTNYKQIAQETLDIIANSGYSLEGENSSLGGNFDKAIVISPQVALRIAEGAKRKSDCDTGCCEIIVENIDSFEAAKKYGIGQTFVLNFANAYRPGGGFLNGAMAQEESLCRCSTLYASLSSDSAKEMYVFNLEQRSPGGSDYMIFSPTVVVFRNSEYQLLLHPFKISVLTAAAPNLEGDAAMCSKKEIEKLFCRKIGNVISTAVFYKYDTLILGAWGCGAFCNDAKDVAEYFHKVLVEKNMRQYFKKIVFAIYSKYEGYNLAQFQKRFCE